MYSQPVLAKRDPVDFVQVQSGTRRIPDRGRLRWPVKCLAEVVRFAGMAPALMVAQVHICLLKHDGKPYCHKPCYATLFGPKGVNIGGAGSYIYDTPPPTPINSSTDSPSDGSPTTPWTIAQVARQQPKAAPAYIKTFAGETSLCPGCGKAVYFAEKVMSLGRNWHRPCLRCERCRKTLTPGGHAEVLPPPIPGRATLLKQPTPPQLRGLICFYLWLQHEGRPYCHVPCYGYLFGPKGVNIGEVGCYIYEPDQSKQDELS
ncbi:cysteine-rich protein 3 [Arapaima gigas]